MTEEETTTFISIREAADMYGLSRQQMAKQVRTRKLAGRVRVLEIPSTRPKLCREDIIKDIKENLK